MECTDTYRACGGTADRLGTIPYAIAIANQTQRILLIRWTQPAQLEEFLMPPLGGMDWRVPSWLLESFESISNGGVQNAKNKFVKYATYEEKILKFAHAPTLPLLRMKFQAHDHGAGYYNANARRFANEPTFEQVFHDTWRVLFTPTPPISAMIEQNMINLNLLPGRYVSVHIRALYNVEERDQAHINYWAQNGIRCATSKFGDLDASMSQALPILFVSDSTDATQAAKSYAKEQDLDHYVVTRSHDHQPLHLEKDKEATQKNDENGDIDGDALSGVAISRQRDPSAFYDTFVDIYMLGMSRCTVYNMGGYGLWGSMIGYNSSCTFHTKANMIRCPLNTHGRLNQREDQRQSLRRPLFFPPIESSKTGASSGAISTRSAKGGDQTSPFTMYQPFDGQKLWHKYERIPNWMKVYFDWHEAQRQKYLNPKDWQSMDYLVMQCLKGAQKCGGTSDRLKPTPTLLRIAQMTNRFLLIQWSRPSKLEDFLLPPKGGIDWRVPDWLGKSVCYYSRDGDNVISEIVVCFRGSHCQLTGPELAERGVWTTPGDELREFANGEEMVVRSRYQSFNGGSEWYNENLYPGEVDFDHLYHDVWKIFFTPSPPVATRIQRELENLGLMPGEYASAHVRALYAIAARPVKSIERWTKNGLNCASQLRPGKPIFLASDSDYAAEVALEYGRKRNASIVVHQSNPNPPLHLDKTNDTAPRPPSDYYDTFIDLYLLALGGCVFHNKGGFGSWGLLIGGNVSCVYRQKHSKVKGIDNPCNWTAPTGIPPKTASAQAEEISLFLEPMD